MNNKKFKLIANEVINLEIQALRKLKNNIESCGNEYLINYLLAPPLE